MDRSHGSAWGEILARIPDDVQRTHHGRSPAEGFDCIGMPIWGYREKGHPLDDLDMVYSEDQAESLNRNGLIESLLATKLRDVTDQVRACLDKDGDLWLLEGGRKLVHAGIQCDGVVWHMGEKLFRRTARKLRPMLIRAFRV